MKLTKSKLYQLIREELEIHLAPENLDELDPEEAYGLGYQAKEDHEEGSGEGSMARKQLARTSELASMLQTSITDDTNLEEWVESKITKAYDYLSSVMNYMRGDELVKKMNEKKN